MKLEIELDLDNVDYDAINRQIVEKISALDIKDMYELDRKIDNRIYLLVSHAVEDAYTDYLSRYWGGTCVTNEGKKFINKVIENEIKARSKQVIEDIFSDGYNEEVLRDIVIKMLPNALTYVLFERLRTDVRVSEIDYQQMVHSMIKSEIDSMINNLGRQ